MENYKCEICGECKFSLISDKNRDGGTDVLNYICENCGFVFIYPRSNETTLEQFYSKSGFSYYARGKSSPDQKKIRDCERMALIRYSEFKTLTSYAYLDICRKLGNALDIGCGTGSFVDILMHNGWKAEGLDPDGDWSEYCEKHYGITIYKETLEKFNTVTRYDLITAFNVIEHVLHPTDFLIKLRELLSDRGVLYLDMPGLDKPNVEIDRFFWKPHINTFSASTLRELFERCGFKIIHLGYSSLKFLTVIAIRDEVPYKVYQSHSANILKLKSIVDSSYSNLNANSNMIFLKPESKQAKLRLVHIGVHDNTNAGDTLLFPAIRSLLQKHLMPIEFSLINVREDVTNDTIDFINEHDGVIIGGGGLFLKDTNANNISGWQWKCSIDLMEKIRVPIIVFAVGYNRFRGQDDFDEVYTQNINLLVEKASFFSMRNNGSIQSLKTYLKPELHDKLCFQPCPTTLLSRYYPYEKKTFMEKVIAFNIPFDRPYLRYSFNESTIFEGLSRTISNLREDGWKVILYNHIRNHDSQAALWLSKYGIEIDQLSLESMPPDKVINWYSQVEVVVGGRGHAQMIPFGLNIPTFSLLSHNKLGWFLDDICHPEWGGEILSPELSEKILGFVSERKGVYQQIYDAQSELWGVTMDNLEKIKDIFEK